MSMGSMGNNSSHFRVPDCNSPFKKRERNWVKLVFAKTYMGHNSYNGEGYWPVRNGPRSPCKGPVSFKILK